MKTFYLLLICMCIALNCFAQTDIQTQFAGAIKSDLLEMQTQQRADSKSLYIITMECGSHSRDAALARRYNHRHDSIASLKVQSIIHVYGYPGPKVIGENANNMLFNIIYNMEIETAKKYVGILWQALKEGNVTPMQYASLADKVSLEETYGQIYGTITQIKGGKIIMPPLLNPGGVDSLRNQIGLPPLQGNPQVK